MLQARSASRRPIHPTRSRHSRCAGFPEPPPAAPVTDSLTPVARLLGQLSDVYGVSGHEAPVRAAVREALPERWKGQPTTVDTAGDLLVEAGPDRDTVVIVAHLDEIGFRVVRVNHAGWATLAPLGGFYASLWEGQPALLHLDAGPTIPATCPLGPTRWRPCRRGSLRSLAHCRDSLRPVTTRRASSPTPWSPGRVLIQPRLLHAAWCPAFACRASKSRRAWGSCASPRDRLTTARGARRCCWRFGRWIHARSRTRSSSCGQCERRWGSTAPRSWHEHWVPRFVACTPSIPLYPPTLRSRVIGSRTHRSEMAPPFEHSITPA